MSNTNNIKYTFIHSVKQAFRKKNKNMSSISLWKTFFLIYRKEHLTIYIDPWSF